RRAGHVRDIAGRCRRSRAGRRGARGFELAHARIEIDVQIALPLLRLRKLVGHHFELTAQLRDFGLELLDLREEIGQTLVAQLRLDRGQALVEHLADLVDTLVGLLDASARLVVIEERVRRRCGERQQPAAHGRCQHARSAMLHWRPPHGRCAHSPAYTMSARRFSAHAASSCPGFFGFSLPKLTVSICASDAPSTRMSCRTASARRCPSAMLYSRLPRSSVLPWIVTRALPLAAR